MTQSIATSDELLPAAAEAETSLSEVASGAASAWSTSRISEVEALWQRLENGGVESPGQSLAFIRNWISALGIPPSDQLYIVGQWGGVAVALLALHRRSRFGVRKLGWFPGSHVGCNAPLADADQLAALSAEQRRQLWAAMLAQARGADVVHLKAVPQRLVEGVDIFAELGAPHTVDTLYRAAFSSWEEANATQRSKSRRKHDRQQGDKLDAMGRVGFEELRGAPELQPVMELMFRQRAARFVEMGVRDPFCSEAIKRFYLSTLSRASGLDVRLHALKLNGEIVALRYNIAHGDRLFCLISSMSTEASLQPGSPGKQCLLRVMQTVFDAGFRVFDMGSGFTDEKRHWCNVQVAVRDHYAGLTVAGRLAVFAHGGWQSLRRQVKANKQLFGIAKAIRGLRTRLLA